MREIGRERDGQGGYREGGERLVVLVLSPGVSTGAGL